MKREFKLPDLGENIEGGDIIGVLVAVGDQLAEDQPVIELETDKAVIEVPSSVAGKIVDIHVKQGDRAVVGASILSVEADGADGAAPAAETTEPNPVEAAATEAPAAVESTPAPAPEATTASFEFRLPDLGENIEAGEVVSLLAKVGDSVAEDQPLIELETDKAVIEVPSSASGKVVEMHVSVGDRVAIGQLVATLLGVDVTPAAPAAETTAPEAPPAEAASAAASAEPVAEPARAVDSAPQAPARLVPAAPSVRRLAREIGVDIAAVSGTGPGGRISQSDVKAHSRALNAERAAAPGDGSATGGMILPDFGQWGEIEREPMSNVRRTTSSRLSQAWATIPHVTQFDKADVTELEMGRKKFARKVEAAGGKLTPAAIVLKVVASALKVFPQFSASIDMANHEVIYKRYCHIGVAVDTDRGLLVPVVRDVDRKNLIELAVELGEIAGKARAKKLRPDDMQGGCFTVSNLGSIGGTGG